MNAITLRNIPAQVQEAIRQRAEAESQSFNKAVLRMLEEHIGLRRRPGPVLHHDVDHLAGTWTEEEAEAFDATLAEQRRVDPELWK